jgi:DNA-binding NarL/FixJ family response regulator
VTGVRVVLADDHALVRAGLRALIETMSGIEVVGEARDGREAVQRVGEHGPHVVLLNVSMPEMNGLEATRRIAAEHPRTKVLVLSMHADEEYVRRALAAGASGYLLKDSDRAELESALRAVARGEGWISPVASKAVANALARGERPAGPFEVLTARQREVLQLVAEGRSTKEIASRLGLSPKTVDVHRSQLMLRLGVRGIPALVRAAIRLGVVPPEP